MSQQIDSLSEKFPLSAALPAGPSIPGWLQTMEFSRRPYEFVRGCSRRFGDTYTLKIAGMGDTVMFSSPEAVRAVFALPGDGMHNGNDVVRYLLNERSVVFLEGKLHQRARQVLSAPLNGSALHSYAPSFLDAARRVSNTWKDGQRINLHHAFQQITFDALMQATFGETQSEEYSELRKELLSFVNGQLTNGMFFASVLLGSRLYDLLRGRADLAKQALNAGQTVNRFGIFAKRAANLARVEYLLEKLVAERRAQTDNEGTDALSRMLQAGDIPKHDIVQQLLTILIAGHDTTSLALSWVMYQVLQRPAVLQRLIAELKEAQTPAGLDPQVVDKLPQLGAVINESLRVTPGAAFVPRRLDKDVEISGVRVPAGTCIAVNVIGAHSRSATWGDPEAFRPERFLDQASTAWTFFPFGGGIRRCLGAAFAVTEMRLVFAHLLSTWDFTLASGYKARPAVHGFLIGPARSLQVIARKRIVP